MFDATIRSRSEQIIEEATTLFSRYGFKDVTVKQLAVACGITEAALYRHFSSKRAIYTAVLEAMENRLVQPHVLDAIAEAEQIDELLRGLAEHILEFFTNNEDLYRLLLYSVLEGHERSARVFDMIRGRYIRFLVKHLDGLYESGEIVQKNNEITARCFVGMVFDCALGFSLWKGMQGRVYEPAAVIANNIPIYAKGLRNG